MELYFLYGSLSSKGIFRGTSLQTRDLNLFCGGSATRRSPKDPPGGEMTVISPSSLLSRRCQGMTTACLTRTLTIKNISGRVDPCSCDILAFHIVNGIKFYTFNIIILGRGK